MFGRPSHNDQPPPQLVLLSLKSVLQVRSMLLHPSVLYSVSSVIVNILGFFSGSLSLLLSELHGGVCENDPHKVSGSANQNFSSATESKGQSVRNVSLTLWWERPRPCRITFTMPRHPFL